MLCETDQGSFAFFLKYGYGTDGASEYVIADLPSGEWLRIGRRLDIDPRSPSEDVAAFQARAKEADLAEHYEVDVESSSRLFDRFSAADRDQARASIWAELLASDPAIAARVDWIVQELAGCSSPALGLLPERLRALVYAGRWPEAPSVRVVRTGWGADEPDVPIDPDFEDGFGKWASFPLPPRLR